MTLQGKGFFIWKIPSCEGGSPTAIANAAQAAGLTHVMLKIADGTRSYNINPTTGADLVPPVAQALWARNIRVWGWHYIYGEDPVGEARKAVQRMLETNLDGYIIDAEAEFQAAGMDAAARAYMNELRAGLPNHPLALSSFRFPSYHPQFPWRDFLNKCDYNMPQVYWEMAHNPASQLTRCVTEFQNLTPFRPIIPTGPTYTIGGWAPTEEDTIEFLDRARVLNLTAANFFSWDECKRYLPELWTVIKNYNWPIQPPSQDIVVRYIAALNNHNPTQVAALYTANAVQINNTRAIQGTANLIQWFGEFFHRFLPNAVFTLINSTTVDSTRHFTWRATSSLGSIRDGSDTMGIIGDRISYHYSFFSPPHL